MAKISTIVTNYNNHDYLKKCLESIVFQSFNDIEILIVDDASTDNSLNTIQPIAEKDNRIKIIRLEENRGAGYARNVGLQNAQGEFISFVDGDDFLFEDFYKEAIKAAEETNSDICSTNISIDGNVRRYVPIVISDKQQMIDIFSHTRNPFLNNKIIKKKCFDGYGYCTRRYIEDTPTHAYCLMHCNRECFTDYCGYFYRKNNASLTHSASFTKETIYNSLAHFEIYEIFMNDGYECNFNPVDESRKLIHMGEYGLLNSEEINAKYFEDFILLNKYVDKYTKNINIKNYGNKD